MRDALRVLTVRKTTDAQPLLVRRFVAFALLIFSLILISDCDNLFQSEDFKRESTFAPIRAQVKALNKRDAEGALAAMHPEAPGLTNTRATTQQITATYDLIFMIQSLKLESATPDEARVSFTQVTQKVAGPEFRNNRVAGVHTLRKFQGTWRIYSTEVGEIEYMDK